MSVIERIVVDSATLTKLGEIAKAHGRTIEEEAADLLRRAAGQTRAEALARLDEIAAMTPKGVKQTDSAILVREDRDR